MNTTHPKILEIHLKRLAVIYIRQSSPLQIENHLESKARQYQLTERAQFLGWPSARCVVIDGDSGISAFRCADMTRILRFKCWRVSCRVLNNGCPNRR